MTNNQRELLKMMYYLKVAVRIHGPIKGYLESMDHIERLWAIEQTRSGQ